MKDIAAILLTGTLDLVRRTLALVRTASATTAQNDNRQLHDTDFIGEYNHRTERLDAGNDPYAWYNEH